ncbi:MAG TPA: methylmalonyl-CoA mutase family protein [Saprospiraceae bacterium]|nr:methylmalonyl-CoA mutase family protein [Saprospiraceae bacterium]
MELTHNEFKPYSKNDWEKKIIQSLKNTSMTDIRWEIFPGVEGLPFASKEDIGSIPITNIKYGNNDWNIGVLINEKGMISLVDEEGIDAICVFLNRENWQTLWQRQLNKQIQWHLPIEIVLNESKQDGLRIGFSEFIQNANGSLIIGSFNNLTFREVQSILFDKGKGFNIVFHIESQKDSKQKTDSFINFITELTEWIENEKLSEKDVAWFFDHLGLMIAVNHQFLFEIAFLRSMQIIWQNLRKLYQLPSGKLKFSALVDNVLPENPANDHLILNTASVTAAIIAGAGTIFVKNEPSHDNVIENQILAKNLQLICKHEVRLDVVSDALAGSYALEELTAKLTNYIWCRLGQM